MFKNTVYPMLLGTQTVMDKRNTDKTPVSSTKHKYGGGFVIKESYAFVNMKLKK